MTYWPSGKLSIGPRSTSVSSTSVKDGSTMKPSTGSVRTPPSAALRPISEASRNFERGYAGSGLSDAAVAGAASSATVRVSGSTSGTSPRTSRVTSRAQRSPKRTASTAPITATIQLMTSPRSRHATPIANPIGHMLGPGVCGVSGRLALNGGHSCSSRVFETGLQTWFNPPADSIARRSRMSTT